MISKNLMAASTKPLILAMLGKGEVYGYQIIQNIISLSGGNLDWSEGMLYPVLHRLEKEGFIQGHWKVSDNGRKRKYYSLTDSGKAELEKERQEWISVHGLLAELWGSSPAFE